MANLKAKDADNTNKFLKATGDGSELNPFIIEHYDSSVIAKLNDLLAELQVKADLAETQPVSVSNFPTTQLINGTVQVSNFSTTQQVAGSVEVNNFPTIQNVDGTIAITNLPDDLPTATLQNTQITRLEAIRDHLADIKSYTDNLELLLTSLNNYVDGLETLLGTANTTQAAISGFVDNLESYTDGIENKLDSLLTEMQGKADLSETQPVSVTNFPATQSVSITNFPATQAIAGNVGLESVSRSTAFFNTTNAGTIATGTQSVAIANIGNAIGTVKGTNLPAGASISWGANANDKLDSINYDATGTTFLITTVT